MPYKVEIEVRKSNRAIDNIAKFMEPTIASIGKQQTITFEVSDPSQWLEDSMKQKFADKLNKADKHNLYHIDSIKVEKI